MTMIGIPTTQTARKNHTCWWCAESITTGNTYSRWLWKDGSTLSAVKVHPECRQAWRDCDDADEVTFGEFSRGCTCENGNCRCKAKQPAK